MKELEYVVAQGDSAWWAVVGDETLVVLPNGVGAAVVRALVVALDTDDSGLGATLEALGVAFGTSLRSFPPFAVVETTDAGHRVVVRGELVVEVGSAVVTGADVTSWREETVPAGAVRVLLPGAVASAEPGVPLERGAALAAEVRVAAPEPSALPAGAPAGRAAPEPSAGRGTREPSAGRGATERSEAASRDHTPPAGRGLDTPALAELAPALDQREEPLAELAPALDQREDPAGRAAPEPSEDAPLAVGRVAPERSEDAYRDHPDDDTDGYDHLFGATIARPLEAAAVRPTETEPADEAPAVEQPADETPVGDLTLAADETLGGEAIPDASAEAPASTLIAGVPSFRAPEPPEPLEPPAPTAPPVDDPDHDGATISAAELARLRASASSAEDAAAPPAAAPDEAPAPADDLDPAPQVLAVRCPAGHENPPHSGRCRVCDLEIAQQEPVTIGRPVLGRIVLSDGSVVTLDRPVVFGRRPRASRVQGHDMPALITVESPEHDISRSHLEVRLESWHVLAVDLDTTNGSTLFRDGQAPRRLAAADPVLLVSGDVVDLGDGVTLRFEDLP